MARPIWSGSIGFGLVSISVRMHAATEESNLSFNLIDKSNGSRIRQLKVNAETGKEVKEGDLIKGYVMGASIIPMTDEDFKSATPEKVDHLEIVQFVKESEIDHVYYERPYYLEPEKQGVKAYVLLREAMKKEGKAALGPLVYHQREWVCLVKPLGDFLVLHRLRFAEEIRDPQRLTMGEEKLTPDELKAASQIIASLTKPFKADQFKDEYAEKLKKVIEAKSKGMKPAEKKPLKVVHNATTGDLMEKLKASLGNKKKAS